MKLRTRSQNEALKFFKENTTRHRGSTHYQAAIDAILADDCLRPRARAKALLRAERSKLHVSRKLVSRDKLEIAILEFTAKHGWPDPALVSIPGREAPIAEARRLADANKLTETQLSKLLKLMHTCKGLWHPLDVQRAKAWAAKKLGKPEPDPRYQLTPRGYSIPLSVALGRSIDEIAATKEEVRAAA